MPPVPEPAPEEPVPDPPVPPLGDTPPFVLVPPPVPPPVAPEVPLPAVPEEVPDDPAPVPDDPAAEDPPAAAELFERLQGLENEVRESISSHGGHFIDILPDYRGVPNPERDYFPVDGHPDADGQAIISRFLAKELTSSAVPELKSSTPDIAMEPGK